ncbi:MAG TPA: PAS domain S-box protein [Noviherbaspirillum sp.]|nr:PAS domain S-box protein [Noviherbaspirillum sp.]
MPSPFADTDDRTRLEMLTHFNPALMWMCDTQPQCTYLSRAWLEFTGRTLEQDLGDGWKECVHPDDLPRYFDAFLAAFRQRLPLTMSYRLRRADGVYRWIQSCAAPCRHDDGRFMGYVGCCIDVTEQRQALQDAEERFRLLVHGVKEYAIVTLDTAGRIRSWNEGAERMTGYSAAEAVGRECASFFRQEDRDSMLPQQLFAAAEREGNLETEGWLVRRDGSPFLAMSSVTALRDECGRLRGYGKVVRDITERRALEAEFSRAKDELQMLVDVSPLAIILLDGEGRVMLWNPAAERLFGWRSDEVLGRLPPIALGQNLQELKQMLAEEIRGVRRNGVELKRLRKDGSAIEVALWSAPWQGGGEMSRGTLRLYADLGERNQTLARLQEANSRLHRLSERILEVQENERRHIARELHDEIGQALTAVKLKLEPMTRCCPEPGCHSPIGECVAMCDDALARVKGLFLGLRPPQLDDLGLVAAVRWHLDQQAGKAGFDAYFHADELPRLAPNAETAIFRVIQEALTNVVRHAEARHVSVKLENYRGQLQVKVRDDGRGFDAAAGRQLLARDGCMGLSGMEERITLLSGRFDIRSEPGKGTMVWAEIPI